MLDTDDLPTTYLTSAFALLTRRPACTVCLYGARRLALQPYQQRRDVLVSILSEPRARWAFRELQERDLLTAKLAVTERGDAALRQLESKGLPLPPEDLFEVPSPSPEPGGQVGHTEELVGLGPHIHASPRRDDLWAELVRDEYSTLRRIALTIVSDYDDAEEVAQNALVIAWRRIEAWDGTRKSLRAWLRRIAVNEALDVIRRKSSRRQLESHLDRELSVDDAWRGALNDTRLMRIKAYEALVEAITRLTEVERHAFMLRYVADVSARDIAEMLDATPSSVQKWLKRAAKATTKS